MTKSAARRIIRLLASLLLCAMAASLPAPAALASEGSRTVPVTIDTGIPGSPDAEIEILWDDGWFASDETAYNHDLAIAAMALSSAAYRGGQHTGVQAALKALGFSNIRSYNYTPSLSEAASVTAYTFAVKEIAVSGGTAYLTAIVIRGTMEYMEWAGNLNMGSGVDHAGFAEARDDLLGRLDQYLSGLNLTGEKRQSMRCLVAGHSRGGAVANLTAARLTDAARGTRGAVYAYTFASPAVSFKAASAGYENIFNIVSDEDLVTQVPLFAWGCARYGTDLRLPTKARDGEAYAAAFAGMDRRYTALTGKPYTVYKDQELVAKLTSAIYKLVPTATGPSMAMLSALLTGNFTGLSDLIHENSLTAILLGRRMLKLSNELTPLIQQEAGGIASAHCMASYYSWLVSAQTPEEIRALYAADAVAI